MGPWSSFTTLTDAITALEDINVKVAWYESISTGTSGVITPPTGGTIALNEFAAGVDILVSGEVSGTPNFEPVLDTEGVEITGTLDASGNWTISGVPADGYDISLIYIYRTAFTDFDYTKCLNTAMVEGPATLEFLGKLTNELTGFTEEGVDASQYSIADTTGVATVSPVGTSFSVWVKGKEFAFTSAQTTTISKAEGVHLIYFDSDGVLQSTQSDFDSVILEGAPVFFTYWNADNDTSIALGEERHGVHMDGATHHYLHDAFGARYYTGLAIGDISADEDGSADSHAYFSITNGKIFDEDLEIDTSDSGQTLATAPAQIPVWYKSGATGTWRKDTADNFPVKSFVGGSSLLAYNLDTAGTWSQEEVTSGRYLLCHIFCTNEVSEPVIAIQGQNQYTNVIDAREGANTELSSLVTSGLPDTEFVPLYTVIYQTSTSYSNSVKARIRTVDGSDTHVDWRFDPTFIGTTAGVTDHNSLSGLDGGTSGEYYHLTSAQHSALHTQNTDTQLVYSGTETLVSKTSGIFVQPTTGDDTQITMRDASETNLAVLRHTANNLEIRNYDHGGDIFLRAENAGGTANYLLNGDPDDSVDLYYGGVKALATRADGLAIYSTNDDDPILAMFEDDGATVAFKIDSITGSSVYLQSTRDGGDVWLSADNSSGTTRWAGLDVSRPSWEPSPDNVLSCGYSDAKWTEVWSVNEAIQSSDSRLKDLLGEAKGIQFINRLQPRMYKWKDGTRPHFGFFAQEIKDALDAEGIDCGLYIDPLHNDPTLPEEENPLGLRYGELIAPTIKAFQEIFGLFQAFVQSTNDKFQIAQERVLALEARVDELENL
jgi:hypothetical protein